MYRWAWSAIPVDGHLKGRWLEFPILLAGVNPPLAGSLLQLASAHSEFTAPQDWIVDSGKCVRMDACRRKRLRSLTLCTLARTSRDVGSSRVSWYRRGRRADPRYSHRALFSVVIAIRIGRLTAKLSDGGHKARRLQPRRPAAVRCSAWLGGIKFIRFAAIQRVDKCL